MLQTLTDYAAILKSNTPILDVRAPQEFSKGALPNSTNLPILDDEERAMVGIEYKNEGNTAAVALGHRLVTGERRTQRVQSWSQFTRTNPGAVLTCWRGGQRSELAQEWLANEGVAVPRLAKGFKAVREMSLQLFREVEKRKFLVVAGPTGVGKTKFLNQYAASIDLEGLANHRGSAFGQLPTPQPTPVTFEIALAQSLLQTEGLGCCLLEDESRTIGRLAIPQCLFDAMRVAPVLVLEASHEERVYLTYQEYVQDTDPVLLLSALHRISKRLGLQRFTTIKAQLLQASKSGSRDAHFEWISNLLTWYYDPMYQYQLSKKQERIVFQGNARAVHGYLSANHAFCLK